MKIDTTTEDPDGNKITFRGELSGIELDFVIQTGLNYLMYHNLLTQLAKKPDGEELH